MVGVRASRPVPRFFLILRDRYKPIRREQSVSGLPLIPDHLERHAFLLRLVTRGVARYDELRRFWDLPEVMRANELLDIQDDVEWLAAEKTRKR